MSCGVGHRHGSDLVLLWLWCRLAAVALIKPLAWEPIYAMGAALKKEKKFLKNQNLKRQKNIWLPSLEIVYLKRYHPGVPVMAQQKRI